VPTRRKLHALSIVAIACLSGTIGATLQRPASQTFRANTTLIEIDTIATDKHGKFVADLKPEDFQLTVDGRPAPIEAHYLVVGNRVQRAHSTAGAPAPNLNLPTLETHRTFILFFDGHVGVAALSRAKDAATEFLRRDFRDGDTAGIVAGGVLFNSRLSQDRRELIAAVRRVRPDGDFLSSDVGEVAAPPDVSAENERAAEGAREIAGNLARAGAQLSAAGAGWEKEKSLVYLLATVQGIDRLPGRKNVLFLSDGFPLTGMMPGDRGGTGHITMRMIVETAARASVRIYSLDTRGLNHGLASSRIFSQAQARPPGASSIPSHVAAEDVMSSLALDTGGLWIHNENNFGRAFAEIAADAGSYYVLGYRSTAVSGDAKFHEFKVRVTRRELTVRARKGYVPK
jgi:VWFA-related protein